MAPGFKVRSASRDAEADRERFGRLEQAFAELESQLATEQSGLATRYQRMTDDAGFSLQALEDRGKAEMSSKVDDLTSSMKAYRARLGELETHAEFVASLHAQLTDYLASGSLRQS
jgi:Skp family chaperone for outer membrane proteins